MGPTAPVDSERRQLSVLFCDLVDSTRLAAGFDPEDWHEIVHLYQQTAGEVIQRLDGHVAQYLGDGLLVYFGFPQAHEDDPERAVRAALDIVDALSARNHELEQRYGIRLAVRAGIHTGPVVVGAIGSGERRETLALGETTNLAARLQEAAAPDGVVLSAATLRLVRGAFVTRDLGPRELKGVGEVPVHQALRAAVRREALEPASGLEPPMVGRQRELALLNERFARVCAGEGQTVAVMGEAGIGKSRLVRAFRVLASQRAEVRLGCRCSPFGRNSPFHPVIELLTQQFDIREGEEAEAILARLEASLHEAGIASDEALALMAGLLDIPLPADRTPLELSPELQRTRTLETLVAWMRSLGLAQPVVLVVEDLHWADPSSLELLRMLVTAASDVRLMIVLTARPGLTLPWLAGDAPGPVELERLSREESRHLAAALSPEQSFPDAALDSIVARADGIPLYVEEITKEVIESGLLVERPGGLELQGDVETLAIPSTLRDSLMARLDRISSAKSVAQVAAALGREFSYDLLLTVAAMPEATLRHGLARLVDAGLLFENGSPPRSSYGFKHALIQDTAYESLVRRTRQRLHARIAEVLEARESIPPELLAHHYDRADRYGQAIAYYQRAGDEARSRASNAEALAHLRRGVELCARLGEGPERDERELALQLALGSTCHAIHGLATEETFAAWSRARDLCKGVGTPRQLATALRGLAMYHDGLSQLDKAIELCDEQIELGRSTGEDEFLLEGYSGAGVARFWQGRFRRSLEDLEAARRIYDVERHPSLAVVDQFVEIEGFAGWALWMLGYPDQSSRRVALAVEHARRFSHRYSLAYALMLSTVSYMSRGEFEECGRYARECRALSERHGFPLFQGVAIANEALVRACTRGEDTFADAAGGLASTTSAGQQAGAPGMLWLLARIHHECGRIAEALALIDDALAMAAATNQPFFDAELLRFRGELTLETGDRKGEEILQRALALSREQEARSLELRTATTLGRVWRERGRPAEAEALLRPIYQRFDEGLESRDLREARELLSKLG